MFKSGIQDVRNILEHHPQYMLETGWLQGPLHHLRSSKAPSCESSQVRLRKLGKLRNFRANFVKRNLIRGI
jgi:hypothetical protein